MVKFNRQHIFIRLFCQLLAVQILLCSLGSSPTGRKVTKVAADENVIEALLSKIMYPGYLPDAEPDGTSDTEGSFDTEKELSPQSNIAFGVHHTVVRFYQFQVNWSEHILPRIFPPPRTV